jgi:hypothetical protein
MNQDLVQTGVTALADAQQLALPPSRVLPWDQTEPSCKVSALAESSSVPDGSDDRCGEHFDISAHLLSASTHSKLASGAELGPDGSEPFRSDNRLAEFLLFAVLDALRQQSWFGGC